MADPVTLARPYAKAAFEVAREARALGEWSRMIGLAAAVAGQPGAKIALNDPGLDGKQVAELLIGLCGEELNEPGRNLVHLLAENKRLPLLPQISALFDALKANAEQSVDVELITAHPASEQATGKLAQALRARLQCEIRLSASVDPELIGGAVIRAGDQVIDNSIRGKLAKLAESLRA